MYHCRQGCFIADRGVLERREGCIIADRGVLERRGVSLQTGEFWSGGVYHCRQGSFGAEGCIIADRGVSDWRGVAFPPGVFCGRKCVVRQSDEANRKFFKFDVVIKVS